MKRVLGLMAATLVAGVGAYAQPRTPRCGLDVVKAALFAKDPAAAARYQSEREAMFAAAAASAETGDAQAKTTAVGPIPVVFHIVVTAGQLNQLGGTTGVAERVDSSLAVIRRDFNRRNSDSTVIPAFFKPFYANVDIEFGLARQTPQGTATPGYEIHTIPASAGISSFHPFSGSTGSGFACSDAKYSPAQGGKGLSAWDPTKYLNVWVCNIDLGVLGIATPPSLSPGGLGSFQPLEERGVVITYGAFGKRRSISQFFTGNYDRGRTLTHELGHFFELEHIWGSANPDNCNDDDGIGDTPRQLDENFGCPSGVLPNCSNAPSAGGEMWMNYMDYCDDACLVMFSNGQAAVARSQVQGSGPSVPLTQNPNLLVPLAVTDVDAARYNLGLSPNPARGAATLTFNPAQKLQSVIVMDAAGRAVRTFADQGINAGALSLDLTGLAAGIYTVRARFDEGAATRKLVIR